MDLLSILPDAWLHGLMYVLAGLVAALALHGFVSATVAFAKAVLGTPSPADSPRKTRAFALIAKVEPWAGNMRLVRDALLIVQHQLELEQQRRALEKQQHALEAQQQALSEKDVVIDLQNAVITASMRPPAMPAADADFDTGRETPKAKKGA
jgi:hypothetical protein